MIKINIDGVKKQIDKEVESKLLLALEYLKNEVDENTPEDTKTLLKNNKIDEIFKVWTKIIWSISNDTEYAQYVEYWVGRNFNYNKPKGSIFYTWVWARMFTRTFENDVNIKKVNYLINL